MENRCKQGSFWGWSTREQARFESLLQILPVCCSRGSRADHPIGRTTCKHLARNNSLSPYIRTQRGFQMRPLLVCSFPPALPQSPGHIVMQKEIWSFIHMELKSAWSLPDGKIFYSCFSASPLRGDRPEAAALHRGAAGGPSYACALRDADRKGRFQVSPFLALYIPCLDGWLFPVTKLGNHTLNFGSGIAKQKPRSFQGNLFHNLDHNVLASRLKLNLFLWY